MSAAAPSFSIVLIGLKPGPEAEETFESIWRQTGVSLEVIVIAHEAEEAGRGWLRTSTAQPSRVIPSDEGRLPLALTQALESSVGEWIYFMRVNDRIVGEHTLSEVYNWSKRTEAGVMVGEVAFDDGKLDRLPGRVNPIAGNFVPMSGGFYRRTLFPENGPFDEEAGSETLYEYSVRLWRAHIRFKSIPIRVASVRPILSTRVERWRAYRERVTVRGKHFDRHRNWYWNTISFLRTSLMVGPKDSRKKQRS